ncbi:MAG TPA: aminotransferase class I/II-fold pyridoxal phosphate-dependent enzyme [Alphaproteobacteria bacterium]|nr:aminotransferase class I/II-fold pyridoxal phosphate-dependent enzyme [Alphaproteobacteria bacterium]
MSAPSLAPRMSRFQPSPSQIATARVRELQAEGRDIIKLTAGEPDFPTPRHVKQAVLDAMERNETRYTPINGTLELRQAACAKFARDNGLHFTPEQITVGSGTKQILFNCLMASVGAGDEVIVPSPYWTSYPDIVKIAGGTPVIVTSGQNQSFKMRPEQLEESITGKTKWLILCSPNNPSGATYTADELRAFGEILKRHPDVWVLTDDVYEHLLFDGREFATIAQAVPELAERTITCNGVSKAYSMTGWRVGFAGGPLGMIQAMSKMQSQSTAGVSAIGQAAATAALNGPQTLVNDRTANLQRRRDILVKYLNGADGLSCSSPEGAMYIFCSCAGVIGKRTPGGKVIESDRDFTLYLLDEVGVAVVQGEAYGLSPYFRASFVAPEEDLHKGGRLIQEACAALQ